MTEQDKPPTVADVSEVRIGQTSDGNIYLDITVPGSGSQKYLMTPAACSQLGLSLIAASYHVSLEAGATAAAVDGKKPS